MFPKWFIELPWDIIDTLINFAELLVICIPASVAFLYYRVQSVAIWARDVTDNGATLMVHNKTNRSIYISNVYLTVPSNSDLANPVVAWNHGTTQLKPDDYLEIIVYYSKKSKNKQIIEIVVEYDRGKKKGIKVKI